MPSCIAMPAYCDPQRRDGGTNQAANRCIHFGPREKERRGLLEKAKANDDDGEERTTESERGREGASAHATEEEEEEENDDDYCAT